MALLVMDLVQSKLKPSHVFYCCGISRLADGKTSAGPISREFPGRLGSLIRYEIVFACPETLVPWLGTLQYISRPVHILGNTAGKHEEQQAPHGTERLALSASAASAASPSLILANHASHGVPAFNVDFAWTLQLSLDRVGQGRRRGTYPFFEMSSSNLPNLPHPRIPAAFACAGTLGIRELAVLVGATVAYERPAGHK